MTNFTFTRPARPVRRVFIHCSASDRPEHDSAAVIDAWHKERGWSGIGYHFFIRKDGTLERGRDLETVPAAQHGHNTATIAICLHGLAREAFTEAQFQTLRALCGQIDRAYGARVTFHGHCEVAAKACPVFDYRKVLGLDEEGRMSALPPGALAITTPARDAAGIEVMKPAPRALSFGMKGDLVRDLQKLLDRLGYFSGGIDGDFGKMTRAAVLSFQADNHLVTDGKIGALTREALANARPRELVPARSAMSLLGLAAKGSTVARASRNNIALGAIIGGGGLLAVVDEVAGQADAIQRLFEQHGLVAGGVILAAGAFVAWQSWRAGKARVQDHRSGKSA